MTDRAAPDPGPRTPADLNPPVPGGRVVGNMLRISGGWALAAAVCGVLAMGWSELEDNGQVWLLWTCVVVAGQLAAIAYSATGISARVRSTNYGHAGFAVGWLASLVLSSLMLLAPAVLFRLVGDLPPPGTAAHLVAAVLFPGLLWMVCLAVLTRWWHLPKPVGAAISIVVVLAALALVMAVPVYYYGFPSIGVSEPGTPWVGTLLLVGTVVLLPLCLLAVRATPIERIREVRELY